jgi:hypothetical protein
MNKEFIPYQEAFYLKERGFNEPCFAYYHEDMSISYTGIFGQNTNSFWLPSLDKIFTAPTYSQAFTWFRKEYALESYIRANLCVDVPKTYQFNIDDNIDDVWYDTYEEAELACLKKLIEIVKGGNK